MNGTLYTCSVANMNKYSHIENKFLITQTCSDNPAIILERYGFLWAPSLAPSKEIFYEYRRLSKLGQWTPDAFNNWYTPAYNNYILGNADPRNLLNYIWKRLADGKDVVIACYCGNVDMCHRKLVGLQFERLGITVDYK